MRFRTRHPALKPTLVAAVIGSIFMSGTALAEEEQTSFWDSVGFTYGTGVIYEPQKTTNNVDSNVITQYTSTLQLGKVSASFAAPVNVLAYYTLSKVRQTNNQSLYADSNYSQDGLKHELLLGRSFPLGSGGFTGSFYYNGTLEEDKKDTKTKKDLSVRTLDQRLRPAVSYWNNDGNWGVYVQYEQIQIDTNSEQSWTTDIQKFRQRGYDWLIQPSIKFGNWRFGLDFYQQRLKEQTLLGADSKSRDTFTEKYYEPNVSYNFENAGVLSVKTRFSKKETSYSEGPWASPGDKYFEDVRKLTVGYEQNLGSWQIAAQYRRTDDDKTSNTKDWTSKGRREKIAQDHYELFATYRF